MEAIHSWLNSLLNKNKSDFAYWPEIIWQSPYNSYNTREHREKLLKKLDKSIIFKNTKPVYNHISKGCNICGLGEWSCLFVTNVCNAQCFYCPTAQNEEVLPSSQSNEFNNGSEYADYVKYFNFKGVSFSGGEPFLKFDLVSDYLKTLRQKCDSDLYIWMYTNGLLADNQKLKSLADSGLDEIRYNIGATGYSLERVKNAQGIIPNITVEIPAVPQEKDRLIALLPEMVKAGVTNLNLHQLRLTNYNARQIIDKGYTIISAEKPLVLESELTALEIMEKAKEYGLNIGINYCSFHFKNRFQKAGFRKVIAKKLFPDAMITDNGYIREYHDSTLIYKTISLENRQKGTNEGVGLLIEGKLFNVVFKTVFHKTNLSKLERKNIDELLNNEPAQYPKDKLLFRIWQLEYIESGLREL